MKRVTRALEQLIAEKYTDADGKQWSQRRLEEAIGISQSQISDIINGKGAGIGALIALSEATGRGIDDLLGIQRGSPEHALLEAIVDRVEELLAAFRKTHAVGPASPIAVVCGELAELVQRAAVQHATPQLDYFARVRELAAQSPLGKKKRAKKEQQPRKDDAPLSERAPRSRRKTA